MIVNKLIFDFYKDHKLYVIIHLILVIIILTLESIIVPRNITNYSKNFNKKYLIILGILFIVVLALYSLKYYLDNKITTEHLSHMRSYLFSQILENGKDNFNDIKAGSTISRIMTSTYEVKGCAYLVVNSITPAILFLFIIAIYFSYYDIKFLFVFVVAFILSYILIRSINLKSATIKKEKFFLNLVDKLNSNFNNLINIYINNSTSEADSKNKKEEVIYADKLRKSYDVYNILQISLSAIGYIVFIMCLYLFYYNYKAKKLTKSDISTLSFILIFFLTYWINLSDDIPNVINKMGITLASEDFFREILGRKSNKRNIKKLSNGEIKFKNLCFKYPNTDSYVIKDLNLEIKDKDKIGIIGKSGSGKTTLMKILLSLYQPTNGTIYIGNIDIKNIDINYLRSRINYVNQRTLLFSKSVIDNMRYGNDKTEKEIISLLNKYDLLNVFSKLNNGIYSNSGVDGNNLSLGMQKIVIIVRAILKVNDNLIIIFDEPLAGLDQLTRKKVMKLIMSECKNKTIIIITHDKEILPYMNKTINLQSLKRN